MSQDPRPTRWSLYRAVLDLVTPEWREIAEASRNVERTTGEQDFAVLWGDIVRQVEAGKLLIRGVRSGSSTAETIGYDLLIVATPDHGAHTLETCGTTYHAVSVFRAGEEPQGAPSISSTLPVLKPATSGELPRPKNPDSKAHTAQDEVDCAAWLEMDWPKRPGWSKPEWLMLAREHWPLLSDMGFDRAWASAARMHSGMIARGRKPRRPG